MSLLGHVPLAVGIALLAGAAIIMWLRPSDNNPLTVMFLTGVALIFLSDQRIMNLKFGASGVEVSRAQLSEAKEDFGKQIAEIRSDIERQKQLLDQHQRLLDARPASPGAAASTPALAPVEAEVKKIEQKFSENSQYLILVFFRQGQRTAAEALSATLVEQGYKSSAIATDLTEISVPGIAADPPPGTTVIARARQVPAALAEDIRAKASAVAAKYRLSQPIVNNDEWPFRRGHIQVYMY